MYSFRHAKMAFVSIINRELYTQSAKLPLNFGYYTPEQTYLITGNNS